MIYLNNRLVPDARASVSVFDRGFLYGDGVYETVRAYRGTVFMLEEHIDRLFCSAAMIGLAINKSPEKIKSAVYKTLEANRLKDALIRITVSRGRGPAGLDPALCRKPTFVVFARKYKMHSEGYYRKGVNIIIARTRRNYQKALDPRIKSLNFLNNILAKMEALEACAAEAVMLNHRGDIAEGTVSNIFFVKDRVLCTPSVNAGILNGITRRIVLKTAKDLNIKTREGRYKREDIYAAREIFISNTSMEIMPVTSIDNRKTGNQAGRITNMLRRVYKDAVEDYIARRKT